MAEQPDTAREYRKLTKLHRGLGVMTQLWLGNDHLLHMLSTGFTESYRRFYLRDIQAMLIVHTGRRLYIALTLFVLLLLVLVIVNASGGGATAYTIMAVIFAPLFIYNHLLGPGCRVIVVTAVQQENVVALSRLPKTRRILAELQPMIVAAQSEIAPAGIATPAADAGPPPLRGPSTPPPLPMS